MCACVLFVFLFSSHYSQAAHICALMSSAVYVQPVLLYMQLLIRFEAESQSFYNNKISPFVAEGVLR